MKIRLNWLGPMQHDSSELRQVRKEATVARKHGCSRVPGHLFYCKLTVGAALTGFVGW